MEVAVVQDARANRVEEGLGQLGLQMVGEQADVVQLDLLPHVHRQVGGLVAELQQLDVLANALVVEGDALGLRLLLPLPVGLLEALLGLAGGLAEQPVMAVEAAQQGLGNLVGAGVVELVRVHGGSRGGGLLR